MPSIESNQLLLTAAAACEDKKAEDIRILELDRPRAGLTDYFLICKGTNERQNVAITDEVELRLKRSSAPIPTQSRAPPGRMDPDGLCRLHRPRFFRQRNAPSTAWSRYVSRLRLSALLSSTPN